MNRPWLRLLLAPLLGLCGPPGSVSAESLVTLRDPAYGLGPAPRQARPVSPRVRQIAYPTVGMPALVEPTERFSVLLRVDCRPDLARLEASLSLVRSPEQVRELRVLALASDQPGPGLVTIHLRAPAGLAADSWDLSLDDGSCVQDTQPSAVRVHRGDETFRFAVLADEQLGDPTGLLPGGDRNGGLYPGRGVVDLAARRRLQVRRELELLDPLFVLYPGDLCFGMDYAAEYAAVSERLASSRLAVFAVPGNHDGYAAHSVSTRPGWQLQLPKAAYCVGNFTPRSPVDGVALVGGCVLQRLSSVLELELDTDGLHAWRRTLGPDSYAFTVGGLRFVGLNTYGGSLARRTAVPVSLGRLRDWVELDLLSDLGVDPLLGAPLVDNYGGFLDTGALDWLEEQASQAEVSGQGLVVFGHHDPSGLYLGELAVLANEPFGTDPVSMGGFETWNYDQPWDSDPGDSIQVETAAVHTGSRLLHGLGPAATLVVGHAHYDTERELGEGSGPRLVQATTGGAGLAHDASYRGYRLIDVQAGEIVNTRFSPSLDWPSLPLGSLWTEDLLRDAGPPDQVLVSGLPETTTGRLRFVLPAEPQGYRFTIDDGPLPLDEVHHGTEVLVAWVEVGIPAAEVRGTVAHEPEQLARSVVHWERALDNQPPGASIVLEGRRSRAGAPLKARAGRLLRLSAAGSRDEQALHSATWSVGGLELEGLEPQLVIERPGRYPVSLRVVDACGAVDQAEAELWVRRGLLGWLRRGRSGSDRAG